MQERLQRITYNPDRQKFYFGYVQAVKRHSLTQLVERARLRGADTVNIGIGVVSVSYLRELHALSRLGKRLLLKPDGSQVCWRVRAGEAA